MSELLPNAEAQPEAATNNWRNEANCLGSDPDMFFPDSKDKRYAKDALAVCRKCEVKDDCLDHAIKNDEKYGIWGGMTPAGRDALSRTRQNRRTRSRLRRNQ